MRLPSDYPKTLVSNYKILGVNESDPMEVINMKYKELVKMLHPDMPLTTEAISLGWTKTEKDLAYISVKNAYAKIKEEKDVERNYPDYEMSYDVGAEFINRRMEDIGFDNPMNENIEEESIGARMERARLERSVSQRTEQQQPSGGKFDPNIFNKNFDLSRQKDIENGFNDPFSKGYDMFSSKEADEERKFIEKHKYRPDINVEINPKRSAPKMNHDGTLVQHDYFNDDNYSVLSTIPTMEIGLNKVNDFSVVISQDRGNQLYGSDLMAVYGENREYWEDSANRDPELMKRFSDTTNVDVKMSRYMNDRVEFDNKVVDEDMRLKMEEYSSQKKLADFHRQQELKNMERFYADRRLQR